jgi:hypothetical protein
VDDEKTMDQNDVADEDASGVAEADLEGAEDPAAPLDDEETEEDS